MPVLAVEDIVEYARNRAAIPAAAEGGNRCRHPACRAERPGVDNGARRVRSKLAKEPFVPPLSRLTCQ